MSESPPISADQQLGPQPLSALFDYAHQLETQPQTSDQLADEKDIQGIASKLDELKEYTIEHGLEETTYRGPQALMHSYKVTDGDYQLNIQHEDPDATNLDDVDKSVPREGTDLSLSIIKQSEPTRQVPGEASQFNITRQLKDPQDPTKGSDTHISFTKTRTTWDEVTKRWDTSTTSHHRSDVKPGILSAQGKTIADLMFQATDSILAKNISPQPSDWSFEGMRAMMQPPSKES